MPKSTGSVSIVPNAKKAFGTLKSSRRPFQKRLFCSYLVILRLHTYWQLFAEAGNIFVKTIANWNERTKQSNTTDKLCSFFPLLEDGIG